MADNNTYTVKDPSGSLLKEVLTVEECPCNTWETVAAVIPPEKFVGYTTDCHTATNKQLSNAGYRESGKRHLIATATYPKKKEEAYTFNYHKAEFNAGVEYIKKALKSGHPVTVGIDDVDDRIKKARKEYINPDGITDHFVVIVGMGSDSKGNYFHFYDNAVGTSKAVLEVGTSAHNKLYCLCNKPALIGQTDVRSSYGNGLTYVVSTIRESAAIPKAIKQKK